MTNSPEASPLTLVACRPGTPTATVVPPTLAAARDFVKPAPPPTASRTEWITYYLWCADVFRAVAAVDSRHQHEARAEVGIARDWADKLTRAVERVEPHRYYRP